jgi:geranylgeranyl diphosphate synthase type I
LTEPLSLPLLQEAIENELMACVSAPQDARYAEFQSMFAYQMDWEATEVTKRGKRIRPLLVLLATHAVGGNWHDALPAAAALELLHNFSLVHDDIQDKSPTRRGKPTEWVKWGEALAINAGDGLIALSSLALKRLTVSMPAEKVLQINDLTHTALLNLTRGQYLDISFEARQSVPLKDYWEMVHGKTCSLLATALEIGALIGGAAPWQCAAFHTCGIRLGEAYQVQDDWLGIWGNCEQTGKSNQSDLLERKKSHPILTALDLQKNFSHTWQKMPAAITATEIPILLAALEEDGIRQQTENKMAELYDATFALLDTTGCSIDSLAPLRELFARLIHRAQ